MNRTYVNKDKTCARFSCVRSARKRGFCESHYIDERRQGRLPVGGRRRVQSPEWRLRREELAWAAGFVDGEGSFYVTRAPTYKNNVMVTFDISQSGDVEVLERFIRAVGLGKISKPRSIPGHKDAYKVTYAGYEQTQYILALLWPWLGSVKKAAAIRTLKARRDP